MFEHYVKKNGDVIRVLFIYLLLNNYDLKKVKRAIVHIDNPKNSPNAQTEMVFAETTEAIDIEEIDREVSEIIVPTICTETTFQIYTSFNEIICYTPENGKEKLFVDDMSIISPFMIIQENMIVTTSIAKPISEATHGLMSFVEYVLTSECCVGKWHIKYIEESKEFTISYGEKNKEILYRAKEYDKTTTFRLVLYIVKKTCDKLNKQGKWEVSENYKIDRYNRIVD